MTPSKLKQLVTQNRPESCFFLKENMRGAGDTMKNFSIIDGKTHWIIARKKPTMDKVGLMLKSGPLGAFHKESYKYTPWNKELERLLD